MSEEEKQSIGINSKEDFLWFNTPELVALINDTNMDKIEMEIDKNGTVINYNIYNSVINSKKAMSYSLVNKVFNGEYIENYNEFKNDLYIMKELNSILEKARNKRNYINFNTFFIPIIFHLGRSFSALVLIVLIVLYLK